MPFMSKTHKFWNNEPVGIGSGNEIIRKAGAQIKKITLPEGYTWENLTNHTELSEFLSENYVEDSTQEFRLQYSKEFLEWMINSPNNKPKYNLVVRRDKEMVGFAFAKEHILVIRGIKQKVVSVNFLCIKKYLRGHRLAPLIIKEITRRANTENIYQAIFTGGINLFFNLCTAQYFHRQINSEKLFRLGFSSKVAMHEPPKRRSSTRLMTDKDIPVVLELYKKECSAYDLYEEFNEETFAHDLLYKRDLVYTYVYEEDNNITEFGSFFVLNSRTIQGNEVIRTAYLYYRSAKNAKMIVEDLIYHASLEKCDVFNCINIMGNDEVLSGLNFEPGSATLKYYLYNWLTEAIEPSKMFFILH